MMARDQVQLSVRQEPKRAQVVQENNPKNRKPIDPPPIIELKYNDESDPSNAQWLVSPRTFMMVTLLPAKDDQEQAPGKLLIGQTVSSLHRLKDINNKDGGFFVFGDISAKRTGQYKLRFSLFDTNKSVFIVRSQHVGNTANIHRDTEEVVYLGVIDSAIFPVVAQRDFGSMSESTHLTRTFSDQGVKLRVRKDNRSISGVKRSYNNGSPPDTTSPSVPSNMDHHYNTSSHGPVVKRQRSSSSYESNLYHTPAVADTPNSSYTSSAIPSGSRYAVVGNDYRGSYSTYPQYSPGGMQIPSRTATMQSTGWQGLQQNSALPSPTTSVGTQQQNLYATVPSSQQFGDPGSASSIPRNSYSGGAYPYEQQSLYSAYTSPDNNPYPALQMPGSAIPDSSSNQGHTYNTGGYLPSNGSYGGEDADAPTPYPPYGGSRSGGS